MELPDKTAWTLCRSHAHHPGVKAAGAYYDGPVIPCANHPEVPAKSAGNGRPLCEPCGDAWHLAMLAKTGGPSILINRLPLPELWIGQAPPLSSTQIEPVPEEWRWGPWDADGYGKFLKRPET